MKTISKVIFVSLFTLCTLVTHAKKGSYHSFVTIIGMADIIVTGRITSVLGDSCYIFKIDQKLKGESDKQIMVKIFTNWSCDIRWKTPEVGQKLFLCLMKTGNSYSTIGGSESEFFVVGNKLRLFNLFNPFVCEGFSEKDSPKLKHVIVAVKNFLACYVMTGTKNAPLVFQQKKTDDEILRLQKVNHFSNWLFERVKGYNKNKMPPSQKDT